MVKSFEVNTRLLHEPMLGWIMSTKKELRKAKLIWPSMGLPGEEWKYYTGPPVCRDNENPYVSFIARWKNGNALQVFGPRRTDHGATPDQWRVTALHHTRARDQGNIPSTENGCLQNAWFTGQLEALCIAIEWTKEFDK